MSRNAAPRQKPDAPAAASAPAPVAIVVSRYNASITGVLLEGALAAYAAAGGAPESVTIVDAPGAYELVSLSLAAARTGRFAGVTALGCIIRGDTDHDRYIAHAVASGLAQVTIATDVPVAFGVLTVNTARQARERAGGAHGNKGQEAMQALLATIEEIAVLRGGVRKPAASSHPGKAKSEQAKSNGRAVTRSAAAKRGAR